MYDELMELSIQLSKISSGLRDAVGMEDSNEVERLVQKSQEISSSMQSMIDTWWN